MNFLDFLTIANVFECPPVVTLSNSHLDFAVAFLFRWDLADHVLQTIEVLAEAVAVV